MNKLTTLSAAALLALALTGCDKAAEAPKTDKPVAEVKQEAPAAEVKQDTVKAEEPKAEEPKADNTAQDVNAAAEYKKLVDWEVVQGQKLEGLAAQVQADLQTALQKNDPALLEKTLNDYSAQLDGVIKEFDGLNFQSDEIKNLAAKKKDYYRLSSEGLAMTINTMLKPSDEAQKALQQHVETLQKMAMEIDGLDKAFAQKYSQQ
ncbi:hypothetical protein [Caviibacterium pharyngocola]|uniref:Lipoprotein HlpB n=1 Tax=Caviibacterium pharyngocola TaxID=28159 RepID=A0A2M8RWB5_9PAST|nr:hypothetical protein [Caviibacterium pharyngocola]PJG83182.1 hypothetical protein CVP04_05235 [Caviibacterium pharyngocola]